MRSQYEEMDVIKLEELIHIISTENEEGQRIDAFGDKAEEMSSELEILMNMSRIAAILRYRIR